MAYRVTKTSANRGPMGAQASRGGHPGRRVADRRFTRNVTLAGTALGCLFVISAGVAITGRDRSVGSLPNYVASHSALKLAWVEPEHQAQMERDPTLAMQPGAPDIRTKTAAPETGATAPSTPLIALGRVPLPHARPRQLAMAIPLPRARAVAPDEPPAPAATASTTVPDSTPIVTATAEPARAESSVHTDAIAAQPLPPVDASAASPSAPQVASAETKLPQDIAAPAKKPMQTVALMSYAPTSEQIFAPDVTGSIGNPAHDLATLSSPKAADEPVRTRHKPERKSRHDTSAAHGKPDAGKPDPHKPAPSKTARKLTPQEKLWGPVRVASLTPFDPSGGDSGLPRAPYDKQTAVYVISDKTVYMPDGAELEAHSGLGDKMDDPRFVRVRMRGATPPHVYDLKMRESLFHGVEAIRMLPIGGEQAIFGRDGILAHTYMLGPSGQSNGCVSFRNYEAFLRAFKAGKINRLAVISRLD